MVNVPRWRTSETFRNSNCPETEMSAASNAVVMPVVMVPAVGRSEDPLKVTPTGAGLFFHRLQEFLIGPCFIQPIQQELHRFDGVHFGEEFPQNPGLGQDVIG